jgi:hypothetical protein
MDIVKIDKPISKIHWEDASEYKIKARTSIDKPVPVFKKFKLADMLKDFKALRESKGLTFEIPDSVKGIIGENPKSDNQKKKKKGQSGNYISYKLFQKFQFRTARVSEVTKGSTDKQNRTLYRFTLSIGRGKPKKEYFIHSTKSLEHFQGLIGKDVVYLANLQNLPESAKQVKDQKHLLLHVKHKSESISLIIVDKKVRLGSIIR